MFKMDIATFLFIQTCHEWQFRWNMNTRTQKTVFLVVKKWIPIVLLNYTNTRPSKTCLYLNIPISIFIKRLQSLFHSNWIYVNIPIISNKLQAELCQKFFTQKTQSAVRKRNKYFRIVQFVSWNVQYLEHGSIRMDGQKRDKFVEQAREWHGDPRSYFTISKRRSRCFNTDSFVYFHMFYLNSVIFEANDLYFIWKYIHFFLLIFSCTTNVSRNVFSSTTRMDVVSRHSNWPLPILAQ